MQSMTRARLLAPFERLYDALTGARREHNVLIVLAGYVLIWALYGALAKGSQSIHFDMGEMVNWSRAHVLGTAKHPVAGAWLVGLWFDVFPLADWSYYLFAMVVAGVSLWAAWKVSALYLDPGKRVVGLALLMLVPFYNFHALKYNANTAQLPFWALTTWWFLASLETGGLLAAALAGIAAALAMQSKYWSIFLLIGLAAAVLSDPRRGRYFRSAAPWLTIACGAVALAPHLIWLVTNDFPPLHYADEHVDNPRFIKAAVQYLPDVLAYIVLPILLTALAARPSLAAIGDALWPPQSRRRTAVIAFAVPLILPLVMVFAAVAVIPLWAIPAMTLLPVVLLSSPRVAIPREAAVIVVAVAVIFPVVATLAAPFVALQIHKRDVPSDGARYAPLAAEMNRLWHSAVGQPLKIIGGDTNLTNGLVFYLPDEPRADEIGSPGLTPWITPVQIERDGIAVACRIKDAGCNAAAEKLAAGHANATATEVAVARVYFGIKGRTAQYRIYIVPPRS
jgi:4-amino-4-deoxy-L-arabinose transferase-like glycosyltransferase